MDEDKSPYFSYRVRVADITSPKDLVGLKEFTCEITLGNQDTRKIVKSEKDLGDIENKNIFALMEDLFVQRDNWAKERGFTFLDQTDPEKIIALGSLKK